MINFPNTPSENEIFLDDNGRFWLFKNGYWQESIPPFSIDLLRDVQTVYDLDTILFVDSQGTISSISAEQDLPFILDDNSVSNIPFEPYGLPFYTSGNVYDVIDIIKYEPELNSLLYWDGSKWYPFLKEYATTDVDQFNSDNAVDNDVMIWQTDGFVPFPKDTYIDYENSYQKTYLSEIKYNGYVTQSSYDTWLKQAFNTTVLTNDSNMVDLANNRLKCTSSGMYRIMFESSIENNRYEPFVVSRHHFAAQYKYEIRNSSDKLKYVWENNEARMAYSYNYENPQQTYFSIIEDVYLEVGDYMEFYFLRKLIYYSWAFSSNHSGRMSMFKIHNQEPDMFVPVFIDTVTVHPIDNDPSNPVVVNLPAGTYELRPCQDPINGHWAYSPWNVVFGCDANGGNCSAGYIWEFFISSPQIPQRTIRQTNEYFETDRLAFDAAVAIGPYPSISITYQQDVSCFMFDSTYTDNTGSTSFEIWQIN